MILEIKDKFGFAEPILLEELQNLFKLVNKNTLKQKISFLLEIDVLKRYQNGIYYLPHENVRFRNLEPVIPKLIKKKYLDNYNGIRTGAHLMNKYGFTTQVTNYYSVITNNVPKSTRSKKVFRDRVTVSASKIKITKNNYNYILFIEILKNIKKSDLSKEDNIIKLNELHLEFNLRYNELNKYVNQCSSSRRLSYMKNYMKELGNVIT